jgi:hypothetical protein
VSVCVSTVPGCWLKGEYSREINATVSCAVRNPFPPVLSRSLSMARLMLPLEIKPTEYAKLVVHVRKTVNIYVEMDQVVSTLR